MSTFDKREQSFETKYAKDQELEFRIQTRATKLLALWAAGRMDLTSESAEAYARSVVETDLKTKGHEDVIEKIFNDLSAAGIETSVRQVRDERDRQLVAAKTAIMGEP